MRRIQAIEINEQTGIWKDQSEVVTKEFLELQRLVKQQGKDLADRDGVIDELNKAVEMLKGEVKNEHKRMNGLNGKMEELNVRAVSEKELRHLLLSIIDDTEKEERIMESINLWGGQK